MSKKNETISTYRGEPFEGIDGARPTPANHATKAKATLRASLADKIKAATRA